MMINNKYNLVIAQIICNLLYFILLIVSIKLSKKAIEDYTFSNTVAGLQECVPQGRARTQEEILR